MIACLALLLAPPDLASPCYATREAATVRLERLGTAAIPLVTPLFNHRDAEVRNRARRVFRRVALARTPGAFPHYRALAESLPAVVGCPKRWSSSLKYRAHIALDDAYRRSDFRAEPDGSEGCRPGRRVRPTLRPRHARPAGLRGGDDAVRPAMGQRGGQAMNTGAAPSDALREYLRLDAELSRMDLAVCDLAEWDALCDRMDPLRWAMTDRERDFVRGLAAGPSEFTR